MRFKFADADTLQTSGATIHVSLLSGSINGTVVSSTAPVFMEDGFAGVATFLFPSSVPVIPGMTYYFTLTLHPGGDQWAVDIEGFNYPGGSSYYQGMATGGDLWFQEGIVVPEPTVTALLLLAGMTFCCRRKIVER